MDDYTGVGFSALIYRRKLGRFQEDRDIIPPSLEEQGYANWILTHAKQFEACS
jgi:hypothetical protein